MPPPFLKNVSLKTRMALSVTGLFVIFVVVASYLTLSYFETTFKKAISSQQFTYVTSLANNIDDKLSIAQNALITVAPQVPSDAWTNADSAQWFVDERIGVKSIFDNVVFIMSKEGKLIAESPYLPDRRGINLSFRDYYKVPLATGKPYISSPFVSTHSPGQPSICMTVPIFDSRGNLKGFIGGGLKLLGKNFLADLAKTRLGKGGYIFIADNNRTLIVHQDKNRIMKPAAPPGANKLVDRAFEGFEGSGETVTSYGTPMLLSCKHLRMASWFVGANYPVSEAYAPLHTARRYFGLAAVVATAFLLFSTWLMMRRLMSPLVAMTRHVEHLPAKSGDERLVPMESTDEIGVLATAFNTMVEKLDQQQESLKEREEKFRLLADFTSDWEYWIDPQLRLVYSSPSCLDVTGYSTEEFNKIPRLLREIVHPDDEEGLVSHLESVHHVLDGNVHGKGEMVFRIVTKQGEIRWLSHVCRPIFGQDGIYRGRRSTNRDITERRRAEDAMHEQTMLLEQEVAERQQAQEALAVKQHQLEALNNSLEDRIISTISDIRKKDQMLIQQSRLAAMGEMINNIAHQWRQPLNNLGLIVQNLQFSFERGNLGVEEMQKESDMAMKTIVYMSRTIDDFRNFFRQDKEKQPFVVNDMVNRVLDFISPSLRNSNISVGFEAEDAIVAVGYPNEYSQVLLNILNNARDVLMERRTTDPRILIRLFREADCAVVTIQDNGGGIADTVLPRVFDPYFSTKEPGKGTGIGLYMSKTIIEQNMNGNLTSRNINGGAEFRIELQTP